LSESLAK